MTENQQNQWCVDMIRVVVLGLAPLYGSEPNGAREPVVQFDPLSWYHEGTRWNRASYTNRR